MRPFSDLPPGATVQPCPYLAPPLGTHWLEVQLLGEDDKGISFAEYEIALPDGHIVRGYLDEHGYGRLEGIEQTGMCAVRFPALDNAAWERISTKEQRTGDAAETQD
ncbi:hypothetical protein LJR289_002096 [Pseudoduganella sp. LjRoot289]|uniref:hypothetical protein n=1 Tax=Pseudoduganella sp. LjRoot289 TaxID=3342314 RepID=UPI003ED1253D